MEPGTGEFYHFFGGNKYKDGYLLKSVNIKSLEVNNVVPTLEELQRFQDRPSEKGEDEVQELTGLASTLRQKKIPFVKGDTVTVIEGDLKHLMGVVESVENDTVTIMPKHEELHVRHSCLFSSKLLRIC
jgi:transcription elongation factor SPT5